MAQQLPTHEHLNLYGPPLDSHTLCSVVDGLWRACSDWATSITSPYGVSEKDAPSFFEGLNASGHPLGSAIGCTIKGQGREILFASSRRDIASALDLGPHFQQSMVSLIAGFDAVQATDVLAKMGTSSDAWFGWYLPEPEATLLMLKYGAFASDTRWRAAGPAYSRLHHDTQLRSMSAINLERWAHAHVPFRLGWSNYWSAETAARLDFPEREKDANLLTRSKRFANGAWQMQLTREPLNLQRDEHFDEFVRACARFPEIGA